MPFMFDRTHVEMFVAVSQGSYGIDTVFHVENEAIHPFMQLLEFHAFLRHRG